MNQILVVILYTLLFTALQANSFETLNLPLNQEMKENQKKATLCNTPAIAKKNLKLKNDFRYGCFCGKNYPNIKNPSGKSYKRLNLLQREKLITQYYKIKPYDDIDTACMQHDICYLSQGTNAQTCNDALHEQLIEIKKAFRYASKEKRKKSKERRCKNLASDISASLKTIFTIGTGTSLPRLAAFTMNTPLLVGSKFFHKTYYPLKGNPCFLEDINKK